MEEFQLPELTLGAGIHSQFLDICPEQYSNLIRLVCNDHKTAQGLTLQGWTGPAGGKLSS